MSLPELDTSVFLFINNNLQNGFLDIIIPFVTKNAELIFLPLILWTLIRERKKTLLLLTISLVAVALADGSGSLLKILFARQRPCNILENINVLVGCGHSYSMPSNHASNAFAFALVFWFLRKNIISYFFILVATIIGFSRIYVGVHYPSDVVAGAMLGTGVSYLAIQLYKLVSGIYQERSYEKAMYFIILTFSILRIYFMLTGPYDLSPDETHYWEWSRRLDWSYYSTGPMIAYLIYIGTAIFGDNVFGVRILSVVFSALSSIMIYRLGKELYDERTGFVSALLIQIVPLYSIFGFIMSIDSPFIFFWILSLYCFYKAMDRELSVSSKKPLDFYWVILGISVGLGLLTKFTMAFFYFSGFIFLIYYKDARRLLAARGPYIAFIVSMITFSPVIAWNAENGWITLKHTAAQANIGEGLNISAKDFFEFIISQFGIITPVLFIMIFIAVWKLRKDKEGSFLFWFSVPIVSFFVLKSLQGKVQANWALAGYATGFVSFSAYYIRGIELSKKAVKVIVAVALLLSFLGTVIVYFPSILNISQKKDPTIRFFMGWKELGKVVSQIYSEMSGTGPVFIISDSYQISSELSFYMKGNPVTYCINIGRRMNQYDLWPGFENFKRYNAILVRKNEEDIPEDLFEAATRRSLDGVFDRCEIKVITLFTRQKKSKKFSIFKCYDFKGMKVKPAEFY
jgi:undecaprenyl-diphosphatase